ncbi:MAG: plasmid pRiA4b ORF-3 family protein [Oscillochloridaceae bacterium umkhey_bin13]
MNPDDPLDDWLIWSAMTAERQLLPQFRNEGVRVLGDLEKSLAAPTDNKVSYDQVRIGVFGRFGGAVLQPKEVERAEKIFLQIWERGGTGSEIVMEGLIEALALAAQPRSVPFWRQLLDLSRQRDRSGTKRRTAAMAALTFIAIKAQDQAAVAAIVAALNHKNPEVRSLAIYYLISFWLVAKTTPSPELAARIGVLAQRDAAFVVRFQAREAVRIFELPVPLDLPDGVYLLQVKLRRDPASRTIAIRSDQTLDDLHFAIQDAYEWDADHLYTFYMNGKLNDERFAISCPEEDEGFELGPWSLMKPDGFDLHDQTPFDDDELLDEAEEEAEDDDEAFTAANIRLGELGLAPKHSFLYLFDFGDSHQFTVTVIGTAPREPGVEYPQLVSAEGEAPPQYDYEAWDEDDETLDDDEV